MLNAFHYLCHGKLTNRHTDTGHLCVLVFSRHPSNCCLLASAGDKMVRLLDWRETEVGTFQLPGYQLLVREMVMLTLILCYFMLTH